MELRIEELERMVFGKKKKDASDGGNDVGHGGDNAPKRPRDTSSFKRPVPKEEDITDREYHPIGERCADCDAPFTRKKETTVYEEDIVLPDETHKPGKKVTRHTVEWGYCPKCKKWKNAGPPLYASVILGRNIRLYICYLSILIRLSFGQMQTLLGTTYNLNVSDGEIAKILRKEAVILLPEYDALKQRIHRQKGAHYDETPWKVEEGAQGNYAWVKTGTESTDAVFLCGKSRGQGNVEELRGNSAEQVGVSDDYGAYRRFFKYHQLCWAHPHRKLRDLAESDMLDTDPRNLCKQADESFSSLYSDLRLELRKEWNAERNFATRELMMERLRLIAAPNALDPKKLAAIKEALLKNNSHYFTCLLHEGIPCDNNKAERALRHLVLKRRTSFGSKTEQGANATAILASVLLSLFWRKPKNFFAELTALAHPAIAA
jgi:transposase